MFWALLAALLYSPSLLAVESHPGLEAEATYSEAVIAFHRKQSTESLSILNQLLNENPDYIAALELKALNLKTLGREKEMLGVYEKLLEVKAEPERGPLYFELGSLQQRYQKPKAAKANLLKAIQAKFNEVPARLLVGMIDFAEGNLADAEAQLRVVKAQGASELEMISTFYLGLINLKRGRGALGAGYVLEARDLVNRRRDSPMAAQLTGSINQILDPFNQSQWFANISMLGQYDSNISQIPTAATSQQGSDQATAKTTILAGFGYMGAPLSTLQFVPSYRFNTNKNLAESARVFEYASNTVALAMNVRPLARLAGGLKGELTHTFQNQLKDSNDSTAGYIYRQFSVLGDVGPYVRWTQSENLQLMMEFSLRPQINYQQEDLGGTGAGVRVNYRRDSPTRYFNPSATVSFDQSGTRNLNFNSVAKTLMLSNLFRLPGDYQLTTGLDLALTDYAQASPVRNDTTLTVRGNLARPINSKWTMLSDFSFISNNSNVSGTFTYTRWQVGIGASYSR